MTVTDDGCASTEDSSGADPRGQAAGEQDIPSRQAEGRDAVDGTRERARRRPHGGPQRRRCVPATASPPTHLSRTHHGQLPSTKLFILFIMTSYTYTGSSAPESNTGAEWPGFKSQPRRCRVTVLGKLCTPIVPLFSKQRNW